MLGNYGWALEKIRSPQSYRDRLRRAECWMLHPPAERHVHASCQAFQPASPTQWLTYGCGLCKVPAQSQDQMKWYEQAFPKKGKFTLLHSSFSLGPPQKFPGVKGRQTAAADLPLFYSQAAIINLSGKKKNKETKNHPPSPNQKFSLNKTWESQASFVIREAWEQYRPIPLKGTLVSKWHVSRCIKEEWELLLKRAV